MKKLLFTAGTLAVLALASCSNDETLQGPTTTAQTDPDQISFDVVTNSSSRAKTLWDHNSITNGDFTEFISLVTKHDGTSATTLNSCPVYIDHEKVSKSGDAWVFAGGARYWPEFNLDFFAYSGTSEKGTVTYNSEAAEHLCTISEIELPKDAPSQEDLIYAATPNQTKTSSGVVPINFRHAYAQLGFKVKNEASNLQVDINKISICHITNKGAVTFGAYRTDPQYKVGENDTDESYVYSNNCSWELTNDPAKEATTVDDLISEYVDRGQDNAVSVLKSEEWFTRGQNDDSSYDNIDDVLYVMPQDFNAWQFKQNKTGNDEERTKQKDMPGVYALLNVRVYNIADAGAAEAVTEAKNALAAAEAAAAQAIKDLKDAKEALAAAEAIGVGSGEGQYADQDAKDAAVNEKNDAVNAAIKALCGETGTEDSPADDSLQAAINKAQETLTEKQTALNNGRTQIYGKENNFREVLVPIKPFTSGEGTDATTKGWEAGKKYVYTFIFGRPGDNLGYDPEDPGDDDPEPGTTDPNNPEDDDPTPALVTISYDVDQLTIDDFSKWKVVDGIYMTTSDGDLYYQPTTGSGNSESNQDPS